MNSLKIKYIKYLSNTKFWIDLFHELDSFIYKTL